MKYINFSKLFHQVSKDLSDQGTVAIPKEHEHWPQQWKITLYKTYRAVPRIPLPPASEKLHDLFKLISNRKSLRHFAKEPLSLKELSDILRYSCAEIKSNLDEGRPRRAYPSAGARFPIETYALVLRQNTDLPTGIYHYNVQHHVLEVLEQREFSTDEKKGLFTYEWARGASIAIFLTGMFDRTTMKYGQRGYRYVLLEAGHIGQNIHLASQSIGVGCCSIAGTHDSEVEKLLNIDGERESLIYTLMLGK